MRARAALAARVALALLAAGATWTAPAGAQQATERYVPIGRSPGLSGASTLLGEVSSVDAEAGRLVVRASTGERAVETDDATRIWLDRSAQGQSSAAATLGDCREGQTVEVKLDADGRVAEWIKLRALPEP